MGEQQRKLAEQARMDAQMLFERASYVAPGRYRTLFQTNLETAMMFLNKAIAFDGVSETPRTAAANETADDDAQATEENENG